MTDENRHADHRKAKRQREQKEKEVQTGYIASGSMRLRDFTKDSLSRTGDQIRKSTQRKTESAMKEFH